MRAVNFMKIDYIKTKQQLYFLPLFFVISLCLGQSSIVGFSYMAFIAMIFSTAPFGSCRAKEAGFLVLLPSRTRDRVLGRFMYGMSFMMFAVVSSMCIALFNKLMGKEMGAWMITGTMIIGAVCIFLVSLEFLFLYLVGERVAPNLLGVARILPGMILFFGVMFMLGRLEDGVMIAGVIDTAMLSERSEELMQAGIIAVAASLILLAAVIVVCVKVTEKRDYV